MTTLTARYDGKVLIPEQPVDLPTGVTLRVTVEVAAPDAPPKAPWQLAVEIGEAVPPGEWARVPTDGARNLDHYLYGAPRDDS